VTGEGQRRRVLVVDDDAEIRDLLATVLRRRDLAVDCVADGGEAIAHLHRNTYAVVLLELFMPNVDGFAVLEAMRDGAFASSRWCW
jgi:CheY-like chemotaxis protein